MANVVNVWKPVGITPLEAINKFKEKYPEYRYEIISYAGRLDPMAEGILVLLIGEENKKRDSYLDLDKEYESEIALGISTDSFDSLGLITSKNIKDASIKEIKNILESFLGEQKQLYPPYSSKTVKGKPLYWWTRNNMLNKIEIPEHNIEIYSIKLIDLEKIPVGGLTENIIKNVREITGDFRQNEIIKDWEKLKTENGKKELIKIKIKVSCSSGTYVRRIASDLGEKLNIGAFAYSIKRTKIGSIKNEDCLNLF